MTDMNERDKTCMELFGAPYEYVIRALDAYQPEDELEYLRSEWDEPCDEYHPQCPQCRAWEFYEDNGRAPTQCEMTAILNAANAAAGDD